MNTVIGLGGLFDPAIRLGSPATYSDFGLTLGHWGVHPGPFFELPFLGPSDLRDGLAIVAAYFLTPTHGSPTPGSNTAYLPAATTPVLALPLDETLNHVFDPYAFMRDAYLARRAYLVSDGKISPSEAPSIRMPTRVPLRRAP